MIINNGKIDLKLKFNFRFKFIYNKFKMILLKINFEAHKSVLFFII